jgi:hypothetical protein
MGINKAAPYVQRTTVADTSTGEVLDERAERLARLRRLRTVERHSTQRWTPARTFLTREACDLLVAGFLVMLMGLLLWALAWSDTGTLGAYHG